MKKNIGIFLSCIGVCLSLAGCQKDPSELIVGTWEHASGEVDGVMEFFEDGTMTMSGSSLIHYELNEDGTEMVLYPDEYQSITINPYASDREIVEVSITKDTLTLTIDGQVVPFSRVE